MITIGRKAAGVAIGSRTFTGFFAWVMWLVIHLFNLIGFRNRVMVLINWAWIICSMNGRALCLPVGHTL